MKLNRNSGPESSFSIYLCPVCKGPLVDADDSLQCPACSQTYPIQGGIPDFFREDLAHSQDPEIRRMTAIDRIAKVYESKLWYSVVLALYGGFESPSLPQLIAKVTQKLNLVQGRIIDIACGPGTYGRRVASPSREVFGIDVSMGMLRQGVAYCAQEGIPNMRFARARVEALPFADDHFDAALCCGSLHLFTDTLTALREIARIVKPGAILSVFTFTAGDGGVLRFPKFREWSKRHGLHVFQLPEMEQDLANSGFTEFRPEVFGSILTFTARRVPALG